MINKNFFYSALLLVALLVAASDANAQKREMARAKVLSHNEGFYKEVFMDGGIRLSSRRSLPATKLLGIELEFFASAKTKNLTQTDTLIQNKIFCGSEEDSNGWLLYPDGAPRYRMMYVNGGLAARHALAMGKEAAKNIQKYVANGGGYIGTCAGSFIGSKGSINLKRREPVRYVGTYWNLWPGYSGGTKLTKSRTALILPKKCPLLKYYDFGGDNKVDSVFHNNGNYAYQSEDYPLPKGTEPIALYRYENTKKVKIDGKIGIWAYKANQQSGRVILCGSHPEGVKKGERLELMAGMVLYAMDGNPTPSVKGELKAGEVREMNKRTEDNNPAYTRIGDKQYHHFKLNVPRKCKKVVVTLGGYEGENNFDLSLFAKQKALAFNSNTTLKQTTKGCDKQLVIEKPKAGKWFVSVCCETTVESQTGKYGTEYIGDLSVLNGVPYKIAVSYE